MYSAYTENDLSTVLRNHGVQPTAPRVLVTQALLGQTGHLSADDVYRLVNVSGRRVSKATVYNTLGLLTEKHVIREVIADPNRIFYDPNVEPHYHFYDADTGKLSDIDANGVELRGLPPLPVGTELEGVDVIVRLRSAK